MAKIFILLAKKGKFFLFFWGSGALTAEIRLQTHRALPSKTDFFCQAGRHLLFCLTFAFYLRIL